MKSIHIAVLVLIAGLSRFTLGQADPQWARGVFSLGGADRPVWDAIAWDDGSGEALYIAGQFTIAGDAAARALVRFDGQRWSRVGAGFGGFRPDVRAMAVFDDGSGPALYAGGLFEQIADVPIDGIARWDGAAWSAIGGSTGVSGWVQAMAVFDDGSGPGLYIAGSFSTIDERGTPIAVNGIARWDGAAWSALVGPDGTPGVLGGGVEAMALHDDGSGPALYIAGSFNRAGGQPVNNIVRWDGRDWSTVFLGTNGPIYALAEYDPGDGPALYAGGRFNVASGVAASNLVRWDGSRWHPVAGPLGEGVVGFDEPVGMLEAVEFDGQPTLLVGGQFVSAGGVDARCIAAWDGLAWSALDHGLEGKGGLTDARTAVVFDAGQGPRLFVGGFFETASTTPASSLAQWDGADWSAVPQRGGRGLEREAMAVAVHDDGDGPALYAVGKFSIIDGVQANGVAKWDGSGWSPLGAGLGTGVSTSPARAIVSHDDGSGPAIYVGGTMRADRGAPDDHIARWDGSRWVPVGAGLDGGVVSMLVVDVPGIEAGLYVAGAFAESDGAILNGIARWDGARFQPLGDGIHTGARALTIHDDGTGPALYASASTDSGSRGIHHVYRWNASGWSIVGEPFEDRVRALASFDDGTGPALYAGGSFNRVGTRAASRIARWDGVAWNEVGGGFSQGFPRVDALLAGDAGDGVVLYAAGQFDTAGGQPALSIARWDGLTWQPLSDHTPGLTAVVRAQAFALAQHDDGSGPAIFVAGDFTGAGEAASSGIARWGVMPECRADFDADGVLTIFDFLAFQNAFDAGDLAADFDGDGSLTTFDFLAFQNEFDAGCP